MPVDNNGGLSRSKSENPRLNFLQIHTKLWLEETLNQQFPKDKSLAEVLSDGKVLLRVADIISKFKTGIPASANKFRSYSMNKLNGAKHEIWDMYNNVDAFLKVCRDIGLTDVDLFSASELVEKKDTFRVCLCLRALSRKARASNIPLPNFEAKTSPLVEKHSFEKDGSVPLEEPKINIVKKYSENFLTPEATKSQTANDTLPSPKPGDFFSNQESYAPFREKFVRRAEFFQYENVFDSDVAKAMLESEDGIYSNEPFVSSSISSPAPASGPISSSLLISPSSSVDSPSNHFDAPPSSRMEESVTSSGVMSLNDFNSEQMTENSVKQLNEKGMKKSSEKSSKILRKKVKNKSEKSTTLKSSGSPVLAESSDSGRFLSLDAFTESSSNSNSEQVKHVITPESSSINRNIDIGEALKSNMPTNLNSDGLVKEGKKDSTGKEPKVLRSEVKPLTEQKERTTKSERDKKNKISKPKPIQEDIKPVGVIQTDQIPPEKKNEDNASTELKKKKKKGDKVIKSKKGEKHGKSRKIDNSNHNSIDAENKNVGFPLIASVAVTASAVLGLALTWFKLRKPKINYRIREGDTLSSISRRHKRSDWKEIQSINPSIVNPDVIYAWEQIKVPL